MLSIYPILTESNEVYRTLSKSRAIITSSIFCENCDLRSDEGSIFNEKRLSKSPILKDETKYEPRVESTFRTTMSD
jgi:hypothetical protein